MARAKRHYVPDQIWHITQRCHKREFLLKFKHDRHRWIQWLFEAKRRFGLVVLNYVVTSNHIHLIVKDDSDQKIIPQAVGLVAGRTAQEYNRRKRRKGAFWEDRYHSTAIENGEHLLRCLVYIDLNMVRAGVVGHPSKWPHSGYNEIQAPRRKNIIIVHDRLRELAGFKHYESFTSAHRKWVQAALEKEKTGGRRVLPWGAVRLSNALKTPWELWQRAAQSTPPKVHLNCWKHNPPILRFLAPKMAI